VIDYPFIIDILNDGH